VDLAQEKDIERLRQAALLLEAENRRLVAKVMELSRALSTAHGEDARLLQLRIQEVEDQLARRNHLLFGPSSEKTPTSNSAPQERAPRRGHGPSEQPKLSVVENVLSLDEADRVCNSCGGQLLEWEGQLEESEEVHVLARKFVLVKHLRKKYRCRCRGCIDVALPPPKLFEGARYSVDFAIEVAIQKYLDHLPLERQVRVMKREGLEVTSQTLWDYIEHLVQLVEPGHARLGEFQLIQPVLGADETGWLLMGAPSGERTRWHL
jgi:transposase